MSHTGSVQESQIPFQSSGAGKDNDRTVFCFWFQVLPCSLPVSGLNNGDRDGNPEQHRNQGRSNFLANTTPSARLYSDADFGEFGFPAYIENFCPDENVKVGAVKFACPHLIFDHVEGPNRSHGWLVRSVAGD